MIIKICGLTRPEDVEYCDQVGANLLGFVFHTPSPRYVTPHWAGNQQTSTALKVGVFTGHNVEQVREIATTARLDLLQLHGDQTVEQCQALGPERVIKVLWPSRYPSLSALEKDMACFAPVCRSFLFDSGTSGGGHGQSLGLQALPGRAAIHPWYLAGGLGPHNLENYARCGASGFDLNSALEGRPGIKNHGLVEQAINILRGKNE